MSMKAVIIVAAGVIVAVAARVTVDSARRASDSESALAAIARKEAGVDTQIRRMEGRLAAAEKDQINLQSTLDGLKKSVAAVVKSQAAVPARKQSVDVALQQKIRDFRNDPKEQLRQLAARRLALGSIYGPLFRSLGLSPAQSERFLDVTLKGEERQMDLSAVMRSQGLAEDDPTVIKLRADSDAELQTAQRELLGEAEFRQAQDYGRTSVVRELVSGLAGAAAVAGTPITAQQAEQLTYLLANSSGHYRSGGPAEVAEIEWDKIDTPARAILSESQLTLFKTVEPPGTAYFRKRFDQVFNQATKADAASAAAPVANAPGG
jgi:hypothetical protein